MIKDNPEDSVREEQNGAINDAAGTEEAIKTDKAEEIESPADSEKEQEKEEIVNGSSGPDEEKTIPAPSEKPHSIG